MQNLLHIKAAQKDGNKVIYRVNAYLSKTYYTIKTSFVYGRREIDKKNHVREKPMIDCKAIKVEKGQELGNDQ